MKTSPASAQIEIPPKANAITVRLQNLPQSESQTSLFLNMAILLCHAIMTVKSNVSTFPSLRRQNLHTSGTNPTETAKNSRTNTSPSLQ